MNELIRHIQDDVLWFILLPHDMVLVDNN